MVKTNRMTLIEMLMVLAVIGVLIGMVVGAVAKVSHKGRQVKTIAMMKGIQTAVAEYEHRYGVMPAGTFSKTIYDSVNPDQTLKITNFNVCKEMLAYLVNCVDNNGNQVMDKALLPFSVMNADKVGFLKPDTGTPQADRYLDPWKHGYVIYLDVDLDGKTKIDVLSNKLLDGRAQLYSCGPNGNDDGGLGDDITTWRKDQ